jgi:hypothetical protein
MADFSELVHKLEIAIVACMFQEDRRCLGSGLMQLKLFLEEVGPLAEGRANEDHKDAEDLRLNIEARLVMTKDELDEGHLREKSDSLCGPMVVHLEHLDEIELRALAKDMVTLLIWATGLAEAG